MVVHHADYVRGLEHTDGWEGRRDFSGVIVGESGAVDRIALCCCCAHRGSTRRWCWRSRRTFIHRQKGVGFLLEPLHRALAHGMPLLRQGFFVAFILGVAVPRREKKRLRKDEDDLVGPRVVRQA